MKWLCSNFAAKNASLSRFPRYSMCFLIISETEINYLIMCKADFTTLMQQSEALGTQKGWDDSPEILRIEGGS